MEPESKDHVPSGCSTEEFNRFDNLLRNVLKVPKRDIQDREKKDKASLLPDQPGLWFSRNRLKAVTLPRPRISAASACGAG